jgi:hypothetical protein
MQYTQVFTIECQRLRLCNLRRYCKLLLMFNIENMHRCAKHAGQRAGVTDANMKHIIHW